jgi:hypothetical protein
VDFKSKFTKRLKTLIETNLFNWLPVNYSRGAVKVQPLLYIHVSIPKFILITDGKYHDSNAMDELFPLFGIIYMMD